MSATSWGDEDRELGRSTSRAGEAAGTVRAGARPPAGHELPVLGVPGLQVPGVRVPGLQVLGLEVLGLEVLGLEVLGDEDAGLCVDGACVIPPVEGREAPGGTGSAGTRRLRPSPH